MPFDPNWAHHIPTDLGDAGDLEAFIDKANEHIGDGGLAALVNNAAVSPKTPYKERLGCLNGDEEAWREVFELNFFVPLKLCRGLAAALHRGKGAVVNITHRWASGAPVRGFCLLGIEGRTFVADP